MKIISINIYYKYFYTKFIKCLLFIYRTCLINFVTLFKYILLYRYEIKHFVYLKSYDYGCFKTYWNEVKVLIYQKVWVYWL